MSIFNLSIFEDGIDENLSDDQLLELYKELNKFNKYVYDFVLTYHKYIYTTKDYGTNVYLSMLEAHVITDIADMPGITASELAKKWDRTPAAISQTIKKLEEEDFIIRKVSPKDRKYYNLYLTEKGKNFDLAHRRYDIHSIINTNRELLKKFTPEEIETSRKFMEEYGRIISNE